MDVPVGATQEEGHTGFIHLPSAVLALIFLERRIQPFLSFIDREVDFCVHSQLVGHFIFLFGASPKRGTPPCVGAKKGHT